MWKDVIGYEGFYQVSKSGVVRNKQTKYILTPFDNHGYKRVRFFNNKKPLVHILVALAYIPNPLNLSDVDHINNKRDDNRAVNLRWVSHSENIKKAWDTGKLKKRRKVK